MLKITLTTTQNINYTYLANRLDFKIDYYIDIVCKLELCPRSAIKKITLKEIKDKK